MIREPARKIYFARFSFQSKVLNFKAKSGISAMSMKENMRTKRKRNMALNRGDAKKESCPTMSDAQNKAFAGVGNPMKLVDCRGSMLNFAKRKAENAAKMKAVYGK